MEFITLENLKVFRNHMVNLLQTRASAAKQQELADKVTELESRINRLGSMHPEVKASCGTPLVHYLGTNVNPTVTVEVMHENASDPTTHQARILSKPASGAETATGWSDFTGVFSESTAVPGVDTKVTVEFRYKLTGSDVYSVNRSEFEFKFVHPSYHGVLSQSIDSFDLDTNAAQLTKIALETCEFLDADVEAVNGYYYFMYPATCGLVNFIYDINGFEVSDIFDFKQVISADGVSYVIYHSTQPITISKGLLHFTKRSVTARYGEYQSNPT